jgi:hypothetical protein
VAIVVCIDITIVSLHLNIHDSLSFTSLLTFPQDRLEALLQSSYVFRCNPDTIGLFAADNRLIPSTSADASLVISKLLPPPPRSTPTIPKHYVITIPRERSILLSRLRSRSSHESSPTRTSLLRRRWNFARRGARRPHRPQQPAGISQLCTRTRLHRERQPSSHVSSRSTRTISSTRR